MLDAWLTTRSSSAPTLAILRSRVRRWRSPGGVGVAALEAVRRADLGVGLDDGLELRGGRAVEDDAVGAGRELVEHPGGALLGRADRRREPLLRDQRADVLELLDRADRSMAPGTDRTTSSARNRSSGAGSQPFIATRASP